MQKIDKTDETILRPAENSKIYQIPKLIHQVSTMMLNCNTNDEDKRISHFM